MTAKVKVLHIATRFLNGGTELQIADVLRALPASRYDNFLLVGPESDLEAAHALFGATHVTVESQLQRTTHPLRDALALINLSRFLRQHRFDVVHSWQSKAGILGRLAARLSGTPVVFHSLTTVNFGAEFGSARSLVYRSAERLVGRWTTAYMSVGHDVAQRYLEAGIAVPDRYHVVRSSIRLNRFYQAAAVGRRRARMDLGLPLDSPIIAYVGRLDERKGVRQLPSYLRAVQDAARVPAYLLIAGDGELRADLEETFTRFGVAGMVTFFGFTERVPQIMVAADCIVLLSKGEGLPQVLIQAMATKTPFVAYPVGGTAELLVQGAVGTIVEAGDWAAAARATVDYLQAAPPTHHSPDLSEWDPVEVEARYRELFARFTGSAPTAAISSS